jgi:dolichol-phosphate mannosyltransferase
MPDLSIIIPVYNEEGSLLELHRQIIEVAADTGQAFEIVFVDDGSRDGSWAILKDLAQAHDNIKCLRFRRNFGKAAALRAAAAETTAPLIMTMDADLQDDPAEIPRFIEALGDDYDLISGWKTVRNDPLGKTLPSKVFNWLVGFLTGVKLHDHNCGFKLYRREIFDEVKLYGEMHRFVPVLATAKGFRVNEISVNHRAREHGVSKYGLERLPKGFLDLLTVSFLTGYNQRPQHVIGAMGLASCLVGSIGLIYMTIYWILRMTVEAYSNWAPLHERPLLIFSLGALLLGTQLLCMGFLAELVVSRNQETREPYSIREKIG